jgi:hypothetical protein
MRSGDGMASTENLLDRVRIDITHPQRCEALLCQLRIVADIAEQKNEPSTSSNGSSTLTVRE